MGVLSIMESLNRGPREADAVAGWQIKSKAGGGSVPVARPESHISVLTWLTGLATFVLVSADLVFVILTQASRPWHYAVDALLIGPVLIFYMAIVVSMRRFLASVRDQTKAALELQDLAKRDDLTELFSRRYFFQGFREAVERTRMTKGPLALVLVDVDDLKSINDNYGHKVGDMALRNLAQVLSRLVRGVDFAARLGGDEFGILMPDSDKRGAFSLARRLWQELREHPICQTDGASIYLDVSIGVSGYPWGGDDVDEIMHWADADMYANKVSRKLSGSLANGKVVSDAEAALRDYSGRIDEWE
jgi:diguanylate cyclase (GGDEF)-like protein